MKLKSSMFFSLIVCAATVTANQNNSFAPEFKYATRVTCDRVFHENEKGCTDMICRDVLVNAWAECWKKSMNTTLEQRLIKLKNNDHEEFKKEMALQKSFNRATRDLCAKDCGESRMRGISYNFCRVDAYKYRTGQAQLINQAQLSVSETAPLAPEISNRNKAKDTKAYKSFVAKLCELPQDVWAQETTPQSCKSQAYRQLNQFAFTNNVCDLS